MTAIGNAKTFQENQSGLIRGQLELTVGEMYVVAGDDGSRIQARRATGCLLLPEAGDRVLISREAGQDNFILSVLVKANSETRLVLGASSATCNEDGLRLSAESIEILVDKKAAVSAPEVRLSGVKGRVDFLDFALRSQKAAAIVKNASTCIERLDSVIGRLTQKIRDSYRHIERLDHAKAGRVRRFIRERFVLRSQDATIQADKDIKMDADQIRLG